MLQIHFEEGPGDILVFLTGREDIEALEKMLNEKSLLFPEKAMKLIVCPIFAALPPEEQVKAFAPAPQGTRKVILATNIAETSITINNIKYVVDSGLAKIRGYNAKLGTIKVEHK